MADLTHLDFGGAVARLTLNRPDARNALSIPLIEQLHARADELARSETTTVCVITGAGRCFCAGMDLKKVLEEPGAPAELLGSLAELTLKLRALPQVLVGRINGAAIGGGCGLACLCDLSITHDDAKLGYPEVDIGVCPAVVAPWLIRRVGSGMARRILLRGGTMSGAQAASMGMVTCSVENVDLLDEAVEKLVERLSGAEPEALRATKGWMNQMDGEELADQVRRGAVLSAEMVERPEARESLASLFAR
ncbi:MAG: enoyl-CoA hydratase/isomerase family protein [Planctomycetota bacterium]|jgi:enoyl-CoA hydratase/carnithine racemase